MPHFSRLIRYIPPILGLWLLLWFPASGDEPTAAQIDFFEKNIRPVLVDNCFRCHSTSGKQRANLVLDSREGMLKGGDIGPAIVPGHPEKSRLYAAVQFTDGKLKMPKDGKLAQHQIDDIGKWIAMG